MLTSETKQHLISLSSLSYPYALDSSGTIVASVEAHKGERYTCMGCGQLMHLRHGSVRRAHFSHVSRNAHCTPETALHQQAKATIKKGIELALSEELPYPLCWDCADCGTQHNGNLARGQRRVLTEHWFENIRPDLLIQTLEGKPLVAIEVIVTYEPEPETVMIYQQLGLPVVLVHVEWDMLDQLASGLGPTGVNLLNSSCKTRTSMNLCPRCGRPMQEEIIKVWRGYRCYKCHKGLLVAEPASGSQSSPPFDGYPEKAEMAQHMAVTHIAKYDYGEYGWHFEHFCPNCRTRQSDYYVYKQQGYTWHPDPPYPLQIGIFWWCKDCGTWEPKLIRPGTQEDA